MKLKNELMIICLILFILISVSAVSAADNNTEIITTNNINDNVLSIDSNNENSLSNGNDGSFADLNIAVNGDSSTNIILDRNYSYSSKDTIKDGIVINKNNIVIDGQGHVIDAKGQSRIFYVNSTTVYLKNIIFKNGNAFEDDGGAIYGYGDNLRVINCTFISNVAKFGGAIYSYPTSLGVFHNSNFVDNKADCGGAIYMMYGIKHYVLNCSFESNLATNYGGAIAIYGKQPTTERPYDDVLTVDGSKFLNNKAQNGEAISNPHSATINITNSVLLGNVENLIDNEVYFAYANYNWFGNTYNNRSVKPNLHKSIEVNKWLYFDLIPKFDTSSAIISINNLYDGKTGETSIYSTSKLPSMDVNVKTTNVTIEKNDIVLDNSGKYELNFTLIGNSVLTANCENIEVSKKIKVGGLKELELLIRNTPDNSVIKLDKDYVFISGVDILNHHIYVTDKHNIVIEGNGHSISGIGKTTLFVVEKDSSDITFKNINIINGRSESGAAAYIFADNTEFINCTFYNNTATFDEGGALSLSASNIKIIDCSFINNTNELSSGGAIYQRGGTVYITNTLFENNTAANTAGAIRLGGNADIVNCTFRYNVASGGGAIFYYDGVSISDSTFIGNKALDDTYTFGGGAIYAGAGNITNSMFMYNEALSGAAILIGSSDTVIDKSIFINNTVNSGNGIIIGMVKGGKVINSIFLNNNLNYGNSIVSIYGDLNADYNWFGNTKNDYSTLWDRDNRANLNKWLFLNDTTCIVGNNFETQIHLFVYDSSTQQVAEFDQDDLPSLKLILSSQNLTLNKNSGFIGEKIEGNISYYKGNLIAQYENVKYVIPFKNQEKSWIELDSLINISKDEKKALSFDVHPFTNEVVPFLINNGRISVTSNDSSIVRIDKKNYNFYITGVKFGVAEITIKFDGKNPIGEDRYLPSNVTVMVNVTKIATQIVNYGTIPTDVVDVGTSTNIPLTVKTYDGKSVKGTVSYEYINHNSDVLDITGTYNNNFVYKVIGEGIANVTVRFPGNENYLPCSRDIIFITGRKNPNLYLSDENISLERQGQYFVAVFGPSDINNNFTIFSNDTNVATVEEGNNNNYVIKGINGGFANITFQFNGDNKYRPAVLYLSVFVDDGSTYIDVPDSLNVFVTDISGINPVLRDKQGKHIGGLFTFSSNDTNIVEIDQYGIIHAIQVGVANITVEFVGNGRYLSSKANIIVIVTTDTNNILVNSSVNVNVDERISLNAKLPKGGKLTYSSNDTSVVSVDSRGYISGLKVGVANITIRYDGTEKYDPDTKYVTVMVSRVPTSIDVGKSFAWEIGETGEISAILDPQKAGSLSFTSNNESVVKVDKRGKVTAIGVGETTILVSFDGTEKYMPINKTIDITVYSDSMPTSIAVNKTFDLFVGDTVNIGAVLTPSNAGELTYTSSDEKIVKIDNNGKITAVGKGEANITVDFAGNNKYLANSTKVLVSVSLIETNIEVHGITVNLTESIDLNFNFTHPEAGNLKFEFGDISIAHFENGKIVGDKVGKTTLTVSFKGNSKYAPSNATVEVIVSDVETSIECVDSIVINITEYKSIIATLNPVEAGKLTFTTNNKDIISVDSNGKVRGIKTGNATVTIKFDGTGTKYQSVNKTVNVFVTLVKTSIDSIDSIDVNLTETATIFAKLNPQNVGLLKFSSNDTSVVTVDNKGNIKGIKLGTATVTISFEDKNGKYSSISKNVTVNVVDVETKIIVDCDNINLIYGDESKVNASLAPNVGSLVYESNDTGVVTVDENGNIQTVKSGVATITVSYAGKGKYRSSNKTVTVNVARASTSISINETVKMEIGTLSSLKPVLNPKNLGKLIYTTNDNDVIELQGDGLVYTLSSGTAVVNINFAGNEYYLPSNATVTIVIDSRETEIVVNNSVVIGFGESMNLGAILKSVHNNIPMTNKLNYLSSNSEIVSVDSDGKITANKIGNAVIKISFDGVTSFKPCNATVNVKVDTRTTSVKVDYNSKTLHVDDTDSINATLVNGPKDYVFNYISNNPDIVRVNPVTGAITALSNGTAVITVRYNGDEEYHYSSANITVTVLKYATHINAANSYELVVYENRDLFAVVTPNEGRLTYTSSDESVVTVSNGILTAKKSGSAVVTITFEGDRKYLPSHKSVIVSVDKIPTSINLTDMTLSAGDELKLENIVLPEGVPTRAKYYEYISMDTEIFDVDNGIITTYQDGVAELYVVFKGDDIYLPSNKSVIVTVVKKVLTAEEYNLTVEVDDDAHQATFTFILPEDAEGAFTVNLNGQVYGEPIENGKAVVVIDELEPGDYTAITRYGGDIKYASMSNTTKFHLGKYKIDKNNDIDVSLGGTATYTVHLTKDTQAMEAKTITFKVNGRTYYAVTDMLGYASIKVKLPASKAYTITAQFGSVKVSNKIKVHVIVAKNLKTKKTKNLKVTISLKKVNKKYLANKKVTLKFRGKTYTAKTNKKAVATFTINKNVFSKLKVGKSYSYVVKYAKDSVTKTIKITK